MKPGRELDALVAEKVMGWKYSQHAMTWYPPGLHPAQNMLDHDILAFSTDIAAAWTVVEKLRNFKHPQDPDSNFTIFQWWDGGYAAGWTWHEVEYDMVYGDTAPHVICLAALRVVGALK